MSQIVPAILVHDIDSYRQKLILLENLVEKVHIDIMDGRFVPNTTIEISDIADIPTKLNRAVHLMVLDPVSYFEQLAKYHFEEVSFHYEAFSELSLLAAACLTAKSYNLKIGLALNPETSEAEIKDLIGFCDFIQLMSVNPGFSGQSYLKSVLGKVARVHRLHPELPIVVDGGINEDNIKNFQEMGATEFIIGSAIFKSQPKHTIRQLQLLISEVPK